MCAGCHAAGALLGPSFRVTQQRGQIVASPYAARVVATVHRSSILRAPDETARRIELAAFVADLTVVARLVRAHDGDAHQAAR